MCNVLVKSFNRLKQCKIRPIERERAEQEKSKRRGRERRGKREGSERGAIPVRGMERAAGERRPLIIVD